MLPVIHGNDRNEWFIQLTDEIHWNIADKNTGAPRGRVVMKAGDVCAMPADIRHQGFAPKRSMLMVLENGTPGLEKRYASGELKPYPVDFGLGLVAFRILSRWALALRRACSPPPPRWPRAPTIIAAAGAPPDGPPQVFEFVIDGSRGPRRSTAPIAPTGRRSRGSRARSTRTRGWPSRVRHLDLAGNLTSQDRLTRQGSKAASCTSPARAAPTAAAIDLCHRSRTRAGRRRRPIVQTMLPPGSPPVQGARAQGRRRRCGPPAPYVQAGPWKQDLSAKPTCSASGSASASASPSSISSSAATATSCSAWPAGRATTPTRWACSTISPSTATR